MYSQEGTGQFQPNCRLFRLQRRCSGLAIQNSSGLNDTAEQVGGIGPAELQSRFRFTLNPYEAYLREEHCGNGRKQAHLLPDVWAPPCLAAGNRQTYVDMSAELAVFLTETAAGGLLGAGIMCALRTRFKFSPDGGGHESLGGSVSFVTLLFSFFLGFTIVNLWQAYDAAGHLVDNETNEIRTLYRLADASEGGEPLKATIGRYVRLVAEEEWPAMAKQKNSPKTDAAKDELWREVLGLVKKAPPPGIVGGELLSSAIRFNNFHRDRMNLLGPALHPLLKGTLVVLAVFTLVGFFFLWGKGKKIQFLVDFLIVASVILSVYLILALDDPFSGTGFFIRSDPFVELAERMGS